MEKQIRKSAVDLTDLALGIIVLGIVVVIGSLILLGVRDARLTDLDTIAVANETIAATDAGTSTLANTWVIGITEVVNATAGDPEVVQPGNYSLTISTIDGTGIVDWNGSSIHNGTNVNVTYNYYNLTSRSDWSLANDATTGLAEYGNWFNVIVLIGIAAVILSLIFLAFGRGDSGAGGSY